MADYLEYRIGYFYWNLLFIREVHDCKLKSMAQLLEDIYDMKIHCGEVDKLE